jgi:DNA gyrase/topoisomerase IV subunit B
MLANVSDRPTVDGHRPHVHLGFGGFGLSVVSALSEQFVLTTVRDGIAATAKCARGDLIEAIRSDPSQHANGTTVQFRPDPLIFRYPRVPRTELTSWLEDLSFLAPGLRLSWSIAGDDLAAAGLAGRVALAIPSGLDAVASHRASYSTVNGAYDVEVALGWRTPFPGYQQPAVIYSYANLTRTLSHGSHVDGFFDGISAFFGGRRRKVDTEWLVGAVSVVLGDVQFGEPSRDRLVTPNARAPVAEATKTALETWAISHPREVKALRARRTKR